MPNTHHSTGYYLILGISFRGPPNVASLHILPRVFLRSQQVPHKAASRTCESSSWACQGTCLPQSNMEPKRGSRRQAFVLYASISVFRIVDMCIGTIFVAEVRCVGLDVCFAGSDSGFEYLATVHRDSRARFCVFFILPLLA